MPKNHRIQNNKTICSLINCLIFTSLGCFTSQSLITSLQDNDFMISFYIDNEKVIQYCHWHCWLKKILLVVCIHKASYFTHRHLLCRVVVLQIFCFLAKKFGKCNSTSLSSLPPVQLEATNQIFKLLIVTEIF